jgi:hypothetical protein
MLNGVHTVRCSVNVAGPFDTPSDPKDFSAWLEEMESQMHKNLAKLRGSEAVSNGGSETSELERSKVETSEAETSEAGTSKTEAVGSTESRAASGSGSDGTERPE